MRILVWWLLTFLLSSGVVSGHVVEYYHLDATGNVRAVTNQQGQVIERHDYLPFGEEWCGTAPCSSVTPGQPKRFTGEERGAETGLDYFGARYYGSKVGRFTTVDPVYTWKENLEDPQRWNRYAYGRNNPLRYVDPDGKDPVTAALIIGGLTVFYLLNNPTPANVTTGPSVEPILPNSVVTAALFGAYAAYSRDTSRDRGPPEPPEDAVRTTESGISASRHSVNQKINRGVRSADELEAIKNPLEVRPVKIDDLGRPSQRSVGRRAEVVRNPETGQIVSVNPTSTSKADRLIRKTESPQQ